MMIQVPGGPALAAIEAGPRGARTVVFVHGIAQSKDAFARALAGPLAERYHLVAFDLRGHGDSETPAAITRASLADDVAAVLDAFGGDAPVLAPWSFGGVAVGEYLRRHGDARLGGLAYLAGSVRTGRDAAHLFGPGMMTHARALLSEDPVAYAATARAFVDESTVAPLAPADREVAIAHMTAVPPHVRRPLLAGGEDYLPALARTRVPIVSIHGARDPVVIPAMSDALATARPDLISVRIPDAGHMPWLETPAAFDAALGAFLDAR